MYKLIIDSLKKMEKDVIKDTTISILDEYLYQYNLLINEKIDLIKEYSLNKWDYEDKVRKKVSQLLSDRIVKHKTKAETIAEEEHKELWEKIRRDSIVIEEIDTFSRKTLNNYHHGKSKLKSDFDMDKQVNNIARFQEWH